LLVYKWQIKASDKLRDKWTLNEKGFSKIKVLERNFAQKLVILCDKHVATFLQFKDTTFK
jgi:hypothetical protein